MQNTNLLTIRSDRQDIALDIRTILYINISENIAEIHTSGGKIYKTRMTLEKLESKLGDGFLKPHRSRLVSVTAIHNITDKINLNNGERISYVARKKKELIAELNEKRVRLINNIDITDLIVLYLLSYSEFFVFPQPRSNGTTTVTLLTSSFSL